MSSSSCYGVEGGTRTEFSMQHVVLLSKSSAAVFPFCSQNFLKIILSVPSAVLSHTENRIIRETQNIIKIFLLCVDSSFRALKGNINFLLSSETWQDTMDGRIITLYMKCIQLNSAF